MKHDSTMHGTAERFRHILRLRTAEAHAQAELCFAPFLTAPDAHLEWFLRAQHAGLSALRDACHSPEVLTALPLLDGMLARLEGDLGLPERSLPAPARGTLAPIAVDYLLLGSRLGTEAMRRRELAHVAPERLPRYFEPMPWSTLLWKTLLSALDGIAPRSEAADRVIRDTMAAFRLFESAARAASDSTKALA